MQGVIKSFDPSTGGGTVIADSDLTEYELAEGALEGTLFRMLRQGQRVNFDLVETPGPEGTVVLAGELRIGSEVDMGTPGFPASDHLPVPSVDPREINSQKGQG